MKTFEQFFCLIERFNWEIATLHASSLADFKLIRNLATSNLSCRTVGSFDFIERLIRWSIVRTYTWHKRSKQEFISGNKSCTCRQRYYQVFYYFSQVILMIFLCVGVQYGTFSLWPSTTTQLSSCGFEILAVVLIWSVIPL